MTAAAALAMSPGSTREGADQMKPKDLTAWREAMGFSQQEAADELGYTREAINKMESGAMNIPRLLPLALAARYHRIKPWPECR